MDLHTTHTSPVVYARMRVLLSLLRWHLGKEVHVEIMQFINWDKTIQIDQLFYVKPQTVWQVSRCTIPYHIGPILDDRLKLNDFCLK